MRDGKRKMTKTADEENERLSELFLPPFLNSMTRPLKRALVADNVTF